MGFVDTVDALRRVARDLANAAAFRGANRRALFGVSLDPRHPGLLRGVDAGSLRTVAAVPPRAAAFYIFPVLSIRGHREKLRAAGAAPVRDGFDLSASAEKAGAVYDAALPHRRR